MTPLLTLSHLPSPPGSAGRAAARGCRCRGRWGGGVWPLSGAAEHAGARGGGRRQGPAAAAAAAVLPSGSRSRQPGGGRVEEGRGGAGPGSATPPSRLPGRGRRRRRNWARERGHGSPAAAAAALVRFPRAAVPARAGCAVSRCAGRSAHAPPGPTALPPSPEPDTDSSLRAPSLRLAPPPAHALHAPRSSRGRALRTRDRDERVAPAQRLMAAADLGRSIRLPLCHR